MTLGEKIEVGRKKVGLSKEDFAAILNISLDEVDAIENNELVPDTNELVQISNIIELSLDYLLKNNLDSENEDINEEIKIANEIKIREEKVEFERKQKEKEEERVRLELERIEKEKQRYLDSLHLMGYAYINDAINKTKKVKVDESIRQNAYQKLAILKDKCEEIQNQNDLSKFYQEVQNTIPKKKVSKGAKALKIIIITALLISPFATVGGLFIQTDMYYNKTLEYISNYKGSDNIEIENALNKIHFDYKDSSIIKNEFSNVKMFSNNINAGISDDYYNNLTDSISKNNRSNLSLMCNKVYSNSSYASHKWNLDTYISYISIPRLINGGYLYNWNSKTQYLEWTFKSSGMELNTNIEIPRNINKNKTLFYTMDYNSTLNKMYFYIKYSEDSNYKYDYFEISDLTFDKENFNLKVNIYKYYDKSTYEYAIK